MLRGLKERFPETHLKAFTAIEIGWFAKREKISIEEVLTRLRAAGLGSLPGGGAEIFHPEVREIICDGKLDADEWIEVHRVAHRMGISSNCTMLYGHVERPEHKVDHLLRLRALQDETGGFNAFIGLAYHPENNYLGLKYHTTGTDDLRHIATARLVLDNIPHIKAYWVMLTPKIAQVALSFGADDMDGTIVEERIYHMAGAETEQQLPRAELERILRVAGFTPVERDTLYNPISRPSPAAAPPPAPLAGAPPRRRLRLRPSRRERRGALTTGGLPFHYLAVDGPIGVGKTTLVEILSARFEGVKILEDVENPFLGDFYRDRPGAAFQTQLYFLLSRYKQQRDILQRDLFNRLLLADYAFPKDRIFAYLTLSDDELMLYDKLYTLLEPQVPVPDLVLHLVADVDTCMERIKRRQRAEEKSISREYLAELIDAYNHYYHYYSRSPLLVVDTRHLNFPDRPEDLDELVGRLRKPVKGTEYYVVGAR